MIFNDKDCAAAPTIHPPASVGHNGGPAIEPLTINELAIRLFKMIGPRADTAIVPFECGAPWTGYASEADLKRLGKLQGRINRRAQSDKEDKAERKRIMNKNIRRMRRATGKN